MILSGLPNAIETLDLSYNLLTGSLPSTWSALSSLTVADLSYNSMGGVLPGEQQRLCEVVWRSS